MLAPQEKVVVIAPKEKQRRVIEALYGVRAAHLIDFHEGRDASGLKIGRPLPEGSKASERLVRLRALVRVLALEGKEASRQVAAAEVERRIDAAIGDLEVNVQAVAERRDAAKARLKELDEREAKLRPLAKLPLRLEDYRGYDNLRPFVGTVAEPVTDQDLAPLGAERLMFAAEQVVALFVPTARADAASEALAKRGFREMEVPPLTGAPAEVVTSMATERASIATQLETANAELARLAQDHGDFLLAAEEHLSIEVEKAEAPLAFASSEYAFVVEAWVPQEEVPRLRAELEKAVGADFHFETSAPDIHGHARESAHGRGEAASSGHPEAHQDGHGAPADAQTTPVEGAHAKPGHEELPPTKYRNASFAKPFEFFTSMFSTPRYGEIDPTAVLTFAFPLFFGFMIGDLGYGLIMASLGFLMIRKLGKMEAMKELGVGIAAAGVVAAVFGGVVFHDAFGIPFEAHVPEAEIAEIEHEVEVYNAEHGTHLTACRFFAEHHGETTWGCLLSGQEHLAAGHPMLSKIGDVSTLLIMSVLAAVVHLGLGLVFGVVNERSHSLKHALAKVGWLAILLGFTYQILSIARYNKLLGVRLWFPSGATVGYPDGSVAEGALGISSFALGTLHVAGMELSYLFLGLVVGGVALLLATEGGIAVLEIPSMLANILSYTRLAGVAVAKAAMAAAFNALFLVGMVLGDGGIVLIVVGGVLVILTQTVVLVLGILSSGIQAIRLNYVEFFTKFYKGGGTPFKPFGRVRRFTTESVST